MLRSNHLPVFGWLALTVLAAIGVLKLTAAEPPPLLPVAEPAAQGAIRRVLEGDVSQVGRTGEPMLDDMLGVLSKRGSILNGSVLDPEFLDPEPGAAEPHRRGLRSEKAYAAEQLLKASRLLEGVESPDKDRADLIARIRVEAAKLLSE